MDRDIVQQDELDGITEEIEAKIEESVKTAMAAPEPSPQDALDDMFVEAI